MTGLLWAAGGTGFTFLMTTLGAAVVFFLRKETSNENIQRAFLGFAAGVMIAASVWSLLIPAIEQSGHTFQDCLDAIVKGIRQSCSDLDVYSRAVKYYFSTAEVHFNMSIDLCGENGYSDPPITMTKSSISVSLDDLLDF